jgi:hypothetical protein
MERRHPQKQSPQATVTEELPEPQKKVIRKAEYHSYSVFNIIITVLLDFINPLLLLPALVSPFFVRLFRYMMGTGPKSFDPSRDIPDLSGKVIIVTGGISSYL